MYDLRKARGPEDLERVIEEINLQPEIRIVSMAFQPPSIFYLLLEHHDPIRVMAIL